MADFRPCPVCGESIPQSSRSGHCPACLAATTLHTGLPGTWEDAPWMTLGDCELYEEIGRGGMGVVYRARQCSLDRIVAVKILLHSQIASETQRVRFRREAEAVARLRHPGIVAVHEIGESDGAPWFSMDHIPGRSLEEIARTALLTDHEAAICLRGIALAIDHAHDRGVLHRDLKPSNILLDHHGVPHVTDFGIAARIDEACDAPSLTGTGQSLGSPSFAAPELVLGTPADTRTDVYGLGAILYHSLTGRPPHVGPTVESILLQVRESPPVSPRRLNPTVSRDLETICLKCLAKSPADRYPSASAVAADLGRLIEGKPIQARPIGLIGRAWRWTRRRPATAALIGIVALLTGTAGAGSLHFLKRQSDLAHRESLVTESRRIRDRPVSGTRDRAMASVRAAWAIQPSAELRTDAIAALILPDWSPLPAVSYQAEIGRMPDPTRSGDGVVAARIEMGKAVLSEVGTDRVVAILPGFPAGCLLKLDQNASRLAVARPGSGELEIIAVPEGNHLFSCSHPEPLVSLDWSGDLIAAGSENRFVYIWSALDGRLSHRLIGHESAGVTVRFRPNSRELASVAHDHVVRLWHAGRGELLLTADMGSNNSGPAWWSRDGGSFHFSTLNQSEIRSLALRDPRSVKLLTLDRDEPGPENLTTMDISPDGTLVSTSDDTVCRLWEVSTGRVLATIPKGDREWNVTRFSPDGKTLWISGWDRGMVAWPILRTPEGGMALGRPSQARFGSGNLLVGASSDGKRFILSNNHDGAFLVGHLETGIEATLPHPRVLSAALSPDGRWVATSSYASTGCRLWSLPGGRLERELAAPGIVVSLHFARDSHSLTLRTANGSVRYSGADWAPDPGRPQRENLAGSVLSPDGSLLGGYAGQEIRLLDPDTMEEIVRLPTPPVAGWLGAAQIAFSADASKLAIRAATGNVIVWDLPGLRAELEEIGMAW